MPLATAPNLIEVSDFSEGFIPDGEESGIPPNGLIRAKNILPDQATGSVQVRKGFKRLVGALRRGYVIQALHPYMRPNGNNYVMAVATNGVDSSVGNVIVWAIQLNSGTVTMVSPNTGGTPTRNWAKGNARHGAAIIDGVFYGFPPGERMYSWSPEAGWVDDPAARNFPVWNKAADSLVHNDSNRPSNYAFKKGEEVFYTDPVNGQRAFSAARSLRKTRRPGRQDDDDEGGRSRPIKEWSADEDYERHDRVLIKRQWGGTANTTYWRQYRCRRAHTSSTVNRPGDGTGNWRRFWRIVQLAPPADDEGTIHEDWDLAPQPPTGNIAVWHGDRLWMRADGLGEERISSQRMMFTPPSKAVEGSDVGEMAWKPKLWTIGALRGATGGDGGGYVPFLNQEGDPILAAVSFGYYLLVLKRKNTWVIAGTNRKTWQIRSLARVGVAGPRAWVEHEGAVYFVGDEGMYRTDGTIVQEVPAGEKTRNWFRNALNWAREGRDVVMWSYGGFIWVSLPSGLDSSPDRVVCYDPKSESFWKLDLPAAVATVLPHKGDGGVDQLFFSEATETGTLKDAVHAWLGDKHRSQSSRTSGALVEWNLFLNPSFEPKPLTGNPAVVQDWETITAAQNNSGWNKTNADKVDFRKDPDAAMRGKLGAVVTNRRARANRREGIHQNFADLDTTTHVISGYFRRPRWKKDGHRKIDYDIVRLRVGATEDNPDGELAKAVHTYTYVGRGWWRVEATYAGSTSQRKHGFTLDGERTIQVDKMHVDKLRGSGAPIYFDGDGSDIGGNHFVRGGQWAQVYQYDHPDVRVTPMDDNGKETYGAELITWNLRPGWFPFGALREDRRIRRIWALVRGAVNVVIRGFRNFGDGPVIEVEQTPVDEPQATYFEGKVMPDSFALNIGVSGMGAPAAILGLAADTQPRRVRYKTPAPPVA